MFEKIDSTVTFMENMASLIAKRIHEHNVRKSLKAKVNQIETIINIMQDALAYTDRFGNIIYKNKAFQTIFEKQGDVTNVCDIYPELQRIIRKGRKVENIKISIEYNRVYFYGTLTCEPILSNVSITDEFLCCFRSYRSIQNDSVLFASGTLVTFSWLSKYIGKEITEIKYIFAGDFEDFAKVALSDKEWGIVDRTGKEIVEPKYNYVSSFFNDMATVELNGKVGVVDTSGKVIVEPKYDEVKNFIEGIAPVKLNGKWGYIDKNGKEVVKFKYTNADSILEGLAEVRIDGYVGYIDKNGKEIIKPKYSYVDNFFSEGFTKVVYEDKYGYIDKSGREVVEPIYDYVSNIKDNMVVVVKGDKVGVLHIK